MLDINIFKWCWLQRIIAVLYILAMRTLLKYPYAILDNGITYKSYKSFLNIFCLALAFSCTLLIMFCYGWYRWKVMKLLAGVGGCSLAMFCFLLIAFVKDRRIPTGHFWLSIVLIIALCACVFLYSKMYRVITSSELAKEKSKQ